MVIFQGKRLNPEWTKGEVPSTLYSKGWTDMELFSHWMKDLFLPNIPLAHPILLLVDGYSLHYDPHLSELEFADEPEDVKELQVDIRSLLGSHHWKSTERSRRTRGN